MALKNAIVFGATGLIGEHIFKELLAAKPSSFDRLAIFTSNSTAVSKKDKIEELKKKGVEIFKGDLYKEDDVVSALMGFDTIVSALGRNVLVHQVDIAAWAAKVPSVKRFFPSEYGTDIKYGPQSANEKPHQNKLKVRAQIEKIAEAGNLSYTYIVVGPFSDGFFAAQGDIPYSFDVKARTARVIDDGNQKISFTSNDDTGRAVVAAIKHADESMNKALKINSFTATPNEIVKEFEKQAGTGPWKIESMPFNKFKALEQEAWASGAANATVFTLRRIWTEGGTQYAKRDNEMIGLTDTNSLSEAVALAIKTKGN